MRGRTDHGPSAFCFTARGWNFGTRKEKPENSYLRHPVTASLNAQKYFNVSELESEAIKTHMFHHVILKKIFHFLC